MAILTAYIKKFFKQRQQLLSFLGWFFLGNVILFCVIGLRYLAVILASRTLFATSFYAYKSLFGKVLVLVFSITSFLGQFTLLAFLPCILFVLPVVLVFNKRFLVFPLAVIVATLSVIVLLCDSVIFLNYHFHINATILRIFIEQWNHFFNFFSFSKQEATWIIAICFCILLIEIIWAIFVWKKIILKEYYSAWPKILAVLLGCLGFSYIVFILSIVEENNIFAQQTPNLPLYNNVLASLLPGKNSFSLVARYSETRFSQPLFPNFSLNYPLSPLRYDKHQHPYNIVIIGMDAWRFDVMSKEITPHIQQFAQQAWQFNQHHSGGNSTEAGLFSLFYGLPSNYSTAVLKQQRSPLLIHELLKQNYIAKVFYSSDITVPPFHKMIFSEIKELRVAHEFGDTSMRRDRFITQAFKDFMRDRPQQQPFFAFLFYDSTHNYCQLKGLPEVFPMKMVYCDRFVIDKKRIAEYFNHYKNAAHFVDNEVGQVLETLKKQGILDQTIVIITGDHGEEFDDNQQGYLGHGSNYTRYQVQTPLIVHWPGQKAAVFSHQTSHYDIVPTLMQGVLACKNTVADYSIGYNLLDQRIRPYLLVGSYVNMGIIKDGQSITLLTSGDIVTVDRHGAELSNVKPDLNTVTQALLDMRKYYKR